MAEGIRIQHVLLAGMRINVPIPDYGPRRLTKVIPLDLDLRGETIITEPVWLLLQAHSRPGEWTLRGTVANPPPQRIDQSRVAAAPMPDEIRRQEQLHALYRDWCARQDATAAAVAGLAGPGPLVTIGGSDPTRQRQRLSTI